MFDPAAAFEAWFKRVDDGYIFYPHRFARGIRVSEAERDQMIAAFEERQASYTPGVIALWCVLTCAAITAVVWALDLTETGIWILAAIVLSIFMIQQRNSMHPVLRPVKGRERNEPRRRGTELDVVLGRRYGTFGFLLLTVIGIQFLLAVMRLSDRFERTDLAFALGFGIVLLYGARVAFLTRRANRDKQS